MQQTNLPAVKLEGLEVLAEFRHRDRDGPRVSCVPGYIYVSQHAAYKDRGKVLTWFQQRRHSE